MTSLQCFIVVELDRIALEDVDEQRHDGPQSDEYDEAIREHPKSRNRAEDALEENNNRNLDERHGWRPEFLNHP